MRLFISILYLSFITPYFAQEISKEITGSWEVKQIDSKIFKGGVITYFEFNEQQEIYAKTNNLKDHGDLKKETFIGKYIKSKETVYYQNKDSYFCISLKKEDSSKKQQMIIKEFKIVSGVTQKEVYRTTYLEKKINL